MKAALNGHVDTVRHEMFSDSCDAVRAKLKAMLRQVEELMANKADELFVSISRDYRSVFGGSDAPQGGMMPRVQRIMRKEVNAVIDRAEKIFKRAAGIEVEDDEDDVKNSNPDAEQGGDLPEGAKTEDREASPSNVGDRHNVKMEGNEVASITDASAAIGDGANNLATEPEQTIGTEDVEMANAEEKRPRNASRPRDSGVGMALSEHTSESSAQSTPEPEHGLDGASTEPGFDSDSGSEY